MGDEQGVFRMNISIPRGLKARMDAVEQPVNWSQTAAQAFENKLLELESRREAEKMDDVIARMKAAAQLEAKEAYQAGLEAGRGWAKKKASPKELQRLENLGVAENARHLAQTICGDALGDPMEFWDLVLGVYEAEKADDPDFLRGFNNGAMEVWDQVKHKL